ncbi:DUF262 domain-containing protein [Bacillus cereus]|uniref:DUF262 domain-containing protein n=1 Tax=Bacillus cereus TaxID=1396 RepID=UPI000BF408B3|nr:DUF262 domain-containing protein [Bacillus cereus]PFW06596.1 hypothetical protein COL12_18430 [Bacillus cereus]
MPSEVGIWEEKENDSVEYEQELIEYVDEIKVTTRGVDFSVRELKMLIEDEDLMVPKFQRELVWDPKRKSRFIESILLGYPIPGMFFTELENGQMLIIDGQQRVNTLVEFINNQFKILNRNDINPKWRGMTFFELEKEYQRKLQNSNIRASVFQILSDETDRNLALYSLFERINTGSIQLNSQEIRRAIYFGEFTIQLDNFVKKDLWISAYKNVSMENARDLKKDLRLHDQEIIARYFTIKNLKASGKLKTNVSFKKEINSLMARMNYIEGFIIQKMFEDLEIYLVWLNNNVDLPLGYLFRRPSMTEEINTENIDEAFKGKKFNISLFESIILGLSEQKTEGLKFDTDGFIKLFTDGDFITAISTQTNKIENINYRINAVRGLFSNDNSN